MSLTQVIKIKEIKEFLDENFIFPKVKVQAELLAPPLTKNYALVGTAFDYLVRFYVQRVNKSTCLEGKWICEESIEYLKEILENFANEFSPEDYLRFLNRAVDAFQRTKELRQVYLETGVFSDELIEASLLIAKLDPIVRAGPTVISSIIKNFDSVDPEDVLDLKNLVSLLKPEFFTKKEICLLNPTFGEGSVLVGGADADLIIDDLIIDIKTVKKAEFKREYFRQLLGYYLLSHIGLDIKINKLGIYFSRHGYLLTIDVKELMKDKPVRQIAEEFKSLVREIFHR